MATTWIKPIHLTSSGATASAQIRKVVDYVADDEKTTINPLLSYASDYKKTNGNLITTYACTAQMADMEFVLKKEQYKAQGYTEPENEVLAYHVRQSFKPGEIDAETANAIGVELAQKLTKGAHQFVVCTHIDKEHIHNHIIINSTTIDATRKYRNALDSSLSLQRASDEICKKHGLSVIQTPKRSRGHYQQNGYKEMLKNIINLDDPKYQKNKGLANWARIQNIKQKAEMIRYIKQRQITSLEQLKDEEDAHKSEIVPYKNEIDNINNRQSQITQLQKHIGSYRKAGDAYKEEKRLRNLAERYENQLKKATGNDEEISDLMADVAHARVQHNEFLADNKNKLTAREAAKEYFNLLSYEKLPSVKQLRQEYAALSAEKGKLYGEIRGLKKEIRPIKTIINNMEHIYKKQKKQRVAREQNQSKKTDLQNKTEGRY